MKNAAIDEELKAVYQAESLIYTLVMLSGLMGVKHGLKGRGNLLLGIAALGWWGYDYYTWYAQHGTYWWWFPG